MKSISSVALALDFALSYQVATTVATPVLRARQNVGEVTFCNLSGQCGTVRLPFDNTVVCTSFDGNFAFLNDQLKTMTFTSADCLAYQDLGCSGTFIGGDLALPGTVTVDYTNFNGKNVSGVISSVLCGFE